MGWHTRHAVTLSRLEEHLRSETLNLTAWNHAQGPSSRESASRNPQIDCTCARNRKPRTTAHRFAFSSALALRQAVLRASFRLAPCFAVTRSCDLPTSKMRDASDRLLPPVRLCVHPHLARSRLATATFAAWAPRRVWALRGLTGGPSVSRRSRPLWRIDNRTRTPNRAYRREASVGVILPTAPVAIEPLTSLSPLPLAVRVGTPSRALRTWRKPPRLPCPPPRERRWLVQPGMPSIDKDPS
jgi:hypothetical protein